MINGLPLHAIVVHAAVVFGPLAALAGVAYAVPKWRDWVRWPLLGSVLVLLVSVWVSHFSGQQLQDTGNYSNPTIGPLLETHSSRADVLRIVATVLTVVVALAAWLHRREGTVRLALAGGVAVLAVATGVYVVLVGDAGAQIAWYGTTV
ncbi:MAG: hypothetical protein JWN84_1666 [Nocardioides sp.]|jgi:uncharacterized membrane protein|nr:hypothetical protein [Nocardioides sp.]